MGWVGNFAGEKGRGIFLASSRSNFDGFMVWNTYYLECEAGKIPPIDDDLAVIAVGQNVSSSGVTDTYTMMPSEIINLKQTCIILPSVDSVPADVPKELPILTSRDIVEIAENAFNISKVVDIVSSAYGVSGIVCDVPASFAGLGNYFEVPPSMLNYMLMMQNVDFAGLIQTLYSGFGLIMIIKKDEKLITTVDKLFESGYDEEVVNISSILSMSSSFDSTRIARTVGISIDSMGNIKNDSLANKADSENIAMANATANRRDQDSVIGSKGDYADIAQSIGGVSHQYVDPIPLLSVANLGEAILKDVEQDGTVTISIGRQKETIKLAKAPKTKDVFESRKKINEKVTGFDYRAAALTAKMMFLREMRKILRLKVIMAAQTRTAVIDGEVTGAYKKVTFTGGDISLQKVIIDEDGVTEAEETASMKGIEGFITSVSCSIQSGVVTSTVSYVDVSKIYKSSERE
jgi:hypothetical protein